MGKYRTLQRRGTVQTVPPGPFDPPPSLLRISEDEIQWQDVHADGLEQIALYRSDYFEGIRGFYGLFDSSLEGISAVPAGFYRSRFTDGVNYSAWSNCVVL